MSRTMYQLSLPSLFTLCTAAFALYGCTTTPTQSERAPTPPEGIEIVAELDISPGNITVTPDGRMIVSLHQHFEPEPRVAEIIDGHKLRPFPNAEWNDPDKADYERLDTVLGVQTDTTGVLWMLDNGMRSSVTPKLVGWHLEEDRLYQLIKIPEPISHERSFLNDLAVDRDKNYIYIADPMGDGSALVVVNLEDGSSRRVLEGHYSVIPEDIDLVIDQIPAGVRLPDGSINRPRVGVNPIALDAENEWLYYGPMHGTAIYRIHTSHLINTDLSDDELAKHVERFGNKPISDGSSVNNAGEIYITDLGNNAIGIVNTNGSYRQLFQDDDLIRWPDAFSFGPDNWVYVAVNQLHRGPILNKGEDETVPPFYVIRFRDEAGGVIGR